MLTLSTIELSRKFWEMRAYNLRRLTCVDSRAKIIESANAQTEAGVTEDGHEDGRDAIEQSQRWWCLV